MPTALLAAALAGPVLTGCGGTGTGTGTGAEVETSQRMAPASPDRPVEPAAPLDEGAAGSAPECDRVGQDWRQQGAAWLPGLSDDLPGSMPQVVYETDDGPTTVSDAFVAGVVLDVEPGSGWFWTYRGGKETTHQVRRDHPRVEMTTDTLVVRPCSWIDSSAAGMPAPEAAPSGPEDTVRIMVGGAPDASESEVRTAYEGERVAAFLDATPVLGDESGVFGVPFGGQLLGLVDESGVIDLPDSGTGYFCCRQLRGITVEDLLAVPPQRRVDPRVRG